MSKLLERYIVGEVHQAKSLAGLVQVQIQSQDTGFGEDDSRGMIGVVDVVDHGLFRVGIYASSSDHAQLSSCIGSSVVIIPIPLPVYVVMPPLDLPWPPHHLHHR